MSSHFPTGAINKNTNKYEYPKIANKINKYKCPSCEKDVIFKSGKINQPHFAHFKSDNPCSYYEKPNEAQIHKDAKLLMKCLLETKNQISFVRNCRICKKNDEFIIPEISETSNILLEYRFNYNGLKVADVVYIDNDEILCIIEICNTHRTLSENRPEPWFEINAEKLIKMVNSNKNTIISIPCIRNELCDECIKRYVCKGDGMCLMQSVRDPNEYIKDKHYQCSYNCKAIKCPIKYCKTMDPQWILGKHKGMCMSCNMMNYSRKQNVQELFSTLNLVYD
jgi:hypothetical protein